MTVFAPIDDPRHNKGPRALFSRDQLPDEAPAVLPLKSLTKFIGEYQPIHYLAEPVLRSSALYTLTGSTGAGKTAFLTVLALALGSGSGELIGMEVERARVLYCAFENPDDVRMRFIVAASWLGLDISAIGSEIMVIDARGKPEAILETAKQASIEIGAIVVDTLQAAYDGADANDNVATGEFMRRLRPLAQLPGRPSTIVAAHPVKGASENNLVPYGGGAILNEIDGNLTLAKSKASGLVTLHHQGKFRGLEFQPKLFRFEIGSCAEMKDAKGRIVELPILRPTNEEEAERREKASLDRELALLCALVDTPNGSMAQWAVAIGLKSSAKSSVADKLASLKRDKLVDHKAGKWSITAAGRKVVAERRPATVGDENA